MLNWYTPQSKACKFSTRHIVYRAVTLAALIKKLVCHTSAGMDRHRNIHVHFSESNFQKIRCTCRQPAARTWFSKNLIRSELKRNTYSMGISQHLKANFVIPQTCVYQYTEANITYVLYHKFQFLDDIYHCLGLMSTPEFQMELKSPVDIELPMLYQFE